MKIAISIWNNRISPVFDTARQLLVVDIENGREISRSIESIDEGPLPKRAGKLEEIDVNTLLCGAISEPFAEMIFDSGINIIPFLAGEVEEVLAAYLTGSFPDARFEMPGRCCRPRYCQNRTSDIGGPVTHGKGQGRGQGRGRGSGGGQGDGQRRGGRGQGCGGGRG
ncbi:NifB/NifX family molybdenum-iron cluster-binding protein [Planctomycetota bacterium]